MLVIKVHKDIFPENNGWACMWDGESAVFSLETLQRIIAENPEEDNIRFDIHSNGGALQEALAIYDYLRTSGKTIYTNIEGSCHSAAIVLLLAAPAENRTANAHATAIIHKVSGEAWGDVDDVEAYAETMRTLQNQMIDLYADRTNIDRERLAEIVNEEKERTAEELLQWGFISRINPYITNYGQPTNKLNKESMTNIKEKLYQLATTIGNMVGISTQLVVNYDFVDEDDNVVFTTEGDTTELSIGMEVVGKDGKYTLKDGRTVTIEDGKIAKIEEAEGEPTQSEGEPTNVAEPTAEPSAEPTNSVEPTAEPTLEEMRAELERAQAEIANLKAQNEAHTAKFEEMTNQLTEAHSALIEAAKGIKSNKVIGTRVKVDEPQKNQNQKQNPDKEALSEAFGARLANKRNRK